MIDYVAILEANPDGVLATLDGQNVRTRVFHYLFAEGSKIYFCTDNGKDVYDQMMKNPNVSFCTYAHRFNPVLSIYGKAVFVDDLALKTRAVDENRIVKQIYHTPDNPIFKMLYIDVSEVESYNLGEGSMTYIVS